MNESKTNEQNFLNNISNMFQFILGFLLGVALIAGSAVGAAYYYFKQVSSNAPEKPVYTQQETQTPETVIDQPSDISEKDLEPAPESILNAEVESETVIESEIPDGAYYANVTWPQGLSLRSQPNPNAAKIGGIGFDARILILEESADRKWQKVRIPWSEQEGWVKAGNIKRASN